MQNDELSSNTSRAPQQLKRKFVGSYVSWKVTVSEQSISARHGFANYEVPVDQLR